VVVGDNDGGSAVGESIGEDFAWMHGTAVDQTDGHHADVQNLIRAVDAGAEEMLLLAVGVVADMREQVAGGDFYFR